ncbi:hypothetical protein PpBr36_08181 [Pyricularia pennisetigena]|uniref:hypothetical protein n=1 Tax=Pyricularia pennisetigena TaxID=1578925 RepID=UPI00114DA9AF|nr:hypothetical protein PpBr36_08181 [Pyricularia pennisetigena]TLS24486.1 hypothetical protein PpBr36_08181 [Pyricularia pennisetigena]
MSDIDDDLLALAGGAVSSDEEDGSRAGSRSPAPGKAKNGAAKKTAAKKTQGRAAADDSEEEGEAMAALTPVLGSSSAPSSPRSDQSVPMDESDSDSSVRRSKARDEEENKYPVEGMFMSHAEKAHIMSLREIEREEILAERAQEKEKMHQNRLLRQLVSNNEMQKKRSASNAGLADDDRRKTSRVRTKLGGSRVGETNAALDSLKRARAEKNERTRRREEDKERRKDRSPSYRDGFEDDNDADSEVDWAHSSKKKSKESKPEKEDLPAELEDIQRIRMSRTGFGQVCFNPGFEKKMEGCFVRISVGQDRETQENVYRMAIIKGISKGKEYATDGAHGQIITDQYITAAHGKAVRDWPFIACSNQPFTENEWRRYKTTCNAENVDLPMQSAVSKKLDELHSLLKHSWTEEELSAKIERVRKLKAKFQGHDRLQLEQDIAEYRALGMHDKAKELEAKLETLETPRLAFRTSLQPAAKKGAGSGPNGGLSQQERLAQINAENRRRNRDAVRKAQIQERAQHERRIERSNTPKKGGGTDSGASTPGGGGESGDGGATKGGLLPHLAKLKLQQSSQDKKGLPTIHKPLMDDDIIGALDLDIDEDILN